MDIRRVRLRISGGFAGLVRGAEAEGDELAHDERSALTRHVEAGLDAADDRARDAINYEFEIDTGRDVRRVAFDELNTPADLAPLVRRLRERSRPVSP